MASSEARISAIIEVALDAIVAIDEHGVITGFNSAAERMFGYTRNESIGAPVAEIIIPPHLRDAHTRGLTHYLSTGDGPIIGKIREVTAMRKDGSEFPIEIAITAIKVAGGTEFISHIRDISRRKAAEMELASIAAKNERIAEVLQRSILHSEPTIKFPGLNVHTLYEAALRESEVGGDFYDAFALDAETVAIVVGDVSGKGLIAAGRTAEVRYALRAFLSEDHCLEKALGRLNNFVYNFHSFDMDSGESFIVLALAIVNTSTGRASFASAGAEPTLILRVDGSVDHIDTVSMPIGIVPDVASIVKTTVLGGADTVLLATDGITEARRGKDFLGTDGMLALAQRVGSDKSLLELSQAIYVWARDFAGGRLHDDVCLLLARRN